ncbi:MAG: hypothetical protein OEV42_10730 [Deltaproteobacteria bacterium]|nr:hypothetical protein [Deltaproteobacteria bacterium]
MILFRYATAVLFALLFAGCVADGPQVAADVPPKTIYVKKFECEQPAIGEAARNKFIQLISDKTNGKVIMKEKGAELVIEGAVTMNKMYTIGISSRAVSNNRFVALGSYSEGYNPRRKRFYSTDNIARLAANDLISNLWEKRILGR